MPPPDYAGPMNRARLLLLPIIILCSFPAPPAEADSYRCGRKLVRDGDSVAKLLAVCGEPRLRASGNGTIRVDGLKKKVSVQRWHYKKGSRALEHVVLIYKGRIAAIEVAGR